MPDLERLIGLAASTTSDGEQLTDLLARFAGALRSEGLHVGPDRLIVFCRAAALVGPDNFYWAGRATLVTRQEDLATYDEVFRAWFAGHRKTAAIVMPEIVERSAETVPGEGSATGREASPGSTTASHVELLRTKSFEDMTEAELRELSKLIDKVALSLPTRTTRRTKVSRHGRVDVGSTVRRSFRTGGEPIVRVQRERRVVKRRLIMIMDVSGSMAPYSRGLMMFAHAALRHERRWEAFCFGTRLTRVTRALETQSPDVALARACNSVFDWDGGTRIGESLREFIERYGRSGMARGSVVVICSDGLETGDPELVGEQMARLARLAHRIIWMNPLSAQPGYAPLAGGMRQALPHVNSFGSGHSLASLEALAHELQVSGRPAKVRPWEPVEAPAGR